MATSVSVQSILGSPLIGASNNFKSNRFALPRIAKMNVKCMATDGEKEVTPVTPELSTSPTPTPTPKRIEPKRLLRRYSCRGIHCSSGSLCAGPSATVSTDFFDLFAFSGPAPERINGRLAMIGFVAAIAVELSSGQDVFSQISNGGVPWFLITSGVLSAASLIPLFKGVRAESEKGGFMTPDAELWNGRFAMLGLVALAFTEYVKGSALV